MSVLVATVALRIACVPAPAELIKERYASIQTLLGSGASTEVVTKAVGSALDAVVDFPELGRMTMALHWTELSPHDRTRFLDGFAALVKRQFAAKVLSSRDLVLRVDREERHGETVRVVTNLAGKKSAIDIDFLFGRSGAAWKVFNLIIDDVDQGHAWGRSFDRSMRRGGIEEVLAKMARSHPSR